MMYFNGPTLSQYAESAGSFTPPFPAGTVCWWMKVDNVTGAKTMWARDTSFDSRLLDNEVQVRLLRAGAKGTEFGTITAGVLYHIAAAYEDTGANVTIWAYLDGQFVLSDSQADDPSATGSLRFAGIGTVYDWPGYIDDWRCYNRILSAAEISTIFACKGTDGIRHGLLHRYLFNEGAEGVAASGAGSIKDTVGGLHLTPYNSPTYQASHLKWRRAA